MSEFNFGSSARRLHLKRRFDKSAESKAKPQSPSFGVHHGLIRNPNWPPPPGVSMPTDRRLAKRVRYSFQILVGGRAVTVAGDISATGAMFLLERLLPSSHVELAIEVPGETQPRRLSGEVIRTSNKGGFIAHHVRFNEPEQFGVSAMKPIEATGAVVVR